jgi:hypothetical protein
MKEIVPIAQGSAAITFPAWAPFLSSGWNILIATLGMIVLILTIYNKALEIKLNHRDMKLGKNKTSKDKG